MSSSEVTLNEGGCLWVGVSQTTQDTSHTHSDIDEMSVPSIPGSFKQIQLHLEAISPDLLHPPRVYSIGLAHSMSHLAPSLASLMSKQLPSK